MIFCFTDLFLSGLLFLTEMILFVLLFHTETIRTVRTFLPEIVLSVLLFHTEMVPTGLLSLTEMVLTVLPIRLQARVPARCPGHPRRLGRTEVHPGRRALFLRFHMRQVRGGHTPWLAGQQRRHCSPPSAPGRAAGAKQRFLLKSCWLFSYCVLKSFVLFSYFVLKSFILFSNCGTEIVRTVFIFRTEIVHTIFKFCTEIVLTVFI